MVPTYEVILDDDDGASILVRDNLDGTAMVDADPMHGDVDAWSHERIREMGRNLMDIADAIERNDKGPQPDEGEGCHDKGPERDPEGSFTDTGA